MTTLAHEVGHWDFDHPDQRNEDGSVTIRMAPGSWRRYNISPDTYQLFTGDSWEESTIEYYRETTGLDLTYDDFEWTYDHQGIVKGLSEVLAEWISETLMEIGLDSIRDVTVRDTWSPQFYNFTTDGFEMEFTCDPEQLRSLSEGFDVDSWADEWYRSVDGFMSYIPRRMQDPEWHATYDGEFRIESMLTAHMEPSVYGEGDRWKYAVWEAEWEVYEENVTYELIEHEVEDSGFTMKQLEAWAASLTPTQTETLPFEED